MKDISGQKFGRLKTLQFIGIIKRTAHWLCRCDCGNEKIIKGTSLRAGVTKSCGCLNKEKAKLRKRKTTYGATCANDVFCYYKNHAKKDNREFSLSKEEFLNLIIKPCVYCGKCYGPFKYTGLDRLDSSKGYSKENSVPCCSLCNFMKKHHTKEIFLNHIKLIAEYNNL